MFWGSKIRSTSTNIERDSELYMFRMDKVLPRSGVLTPCLYLHETERGTHCRSRDVCWCYIQIVFYAHVMLEGGFKVEIPYSIARSSSRESDLKSWQDGEPLEEAPESDARNKNEMIVVAKTRISGRQRRQNMRVSSENVFTTNWHVSCVLNTQHTSLRPYDALLSAELNVGGCNNCRLDHPSYFLQQNGDVCLSSK